MVQAGTDLIFDLDSRGARALKNDFPQSTLIFILPPSLAELEKRLTSRGNLPPEELARRLENGRAELREAHWYDYMVVNDDLATALSHLQAIVAAARCRTSQVWPRLASRFRLENPSI
jgi:guanylate kinase